LPVVGCHTAHVPPLCERVMMWLCCSCISVAVAANAPKIYTPGVRHQSSHQGRPCTPRLLLQHTDTGRDTGSETWRRETSTSSFVVRRGGEGGERRRRRRRAWAAPRKKNSKQQERYCCSCCCCSHSWLVVSSFNDVQMMRLCMYLYRRCALGQLPHVACCLLAGAFDNWLHATVRAILEHNRI